MPTTPRKARGTTQVLQESRPKKRARNSAGSSTAERGDAPVDDQAPQVLKQYSGRTGPSKSAQPLLSVALTGARAGDLLAGIASESGGDTANVVLRIDAGVVAAPAIVRRSIEAEVGRERLVASMARKFRVSLATAEQLYADCPTVEVPNHQPLGAGCSHGIDEGCTCEAAARFTILSQGAWQDFADNFNHGDVLRAMVEERRSVCWRDVLNLMFVPGQPDGKKLVLRPRLFEVIPGPSLVLGNDPRLITPGTSCVIDATSLLISATNHDRAAEVSGSSIYDLDGLLVRLPAPARIAFSQGDVVPTVMAAAKGLPVPSDVQLEAAVLHCAERLRCLSGGGLKSCLQKAIRFGASTVNLGGAVVPTPLVAATVVALLFADKGSFSPELQLFTRGGTAAFKRLAVILVEDAWIDTEGGLEHHVLALVALALAMQRMVDYEPPNAGIVAAVRLAGLAAASSCVVAWRTPAKEPSRTVAVPPGSVAALKQAARVLRILRSFGGDMDMFDKVADMASKRGSLPLSVASRRPAMMPICHMVDQHAYRGIAHAMGSGGATFAKRFRNIFDSCTGYNPRLTSLEAFESSPIVPAIRHAQACVARFVLKQRRRQLQACQGTEPLELRLKLDPGVLAAAVGPVPAKVRNNQSGRLREVLVLLGIRAPEDEVVMLRPARATRDLFGSLSDDERSQAVAQVRGLPSLPVRSPLLPPGSHRANFQDGQWLMGGRKWAEVVAEGRVLLVPAVEPPAWAAVAGDEVTDMAAWRSRLTAALSDDDALDEALGAVGDGIVPGAEQAIGTLVQCSPHAVGLRAIALARKRYATVELPTPSLSGGLGSDQLAAYDGDWSVYRLLALVSRLAPGALRPSTPPSFTVMDASLLHIVTHWMVQGTCVAVPGATSSRQSWYQGAATLSPQAGGTHPGNEWAEHPLWKPMGKAEASLLEHQRAAVARMHERDTEADTGHFLIMDTGLGKTVTSLVYAYRWLSQRASNAVKRILWVTPAGTIDNLLEQLRNTWSAPVFAVPRISTAKKPKSGDASKLVLRDYVVNVIHADHLRTAILYGLADEAPASFIVFDEVDEMYAPTLRTSAARRLCQLSAKFVAQTATPMRRNESQLLTWLADTCAFPVTPANWLVAASAMVSMQLELGIMSLEEEVLVPMSDSIREKCRQLLHQRAWLEMARAVQAGTDDTMVEHALAMAKADRKEHPRGGVLLVADNRRHAEKLLDMCSTRQSAVKVAGFQSLEAPDSASIGIVVVTKEQDRGYNSAARLGAMVTGAYAGNGASRHQLRGRLRRLGQVRRQVRFVTVVMENSLLQLLHQRHNAVDSMNISLEQLGQLFSADVMKGLERE